MSRIKQLENQVQRLLETVSGQQRELERLRARLGEQGSAGTDDRGEIARRRFFGAATAMAVTASGAGLLATAPGASAARVRRGPLEGYTGEGNTALGRDAASYLDPNEPQNSDGGYYNAAFGHEAMFAADFSHRTTAVGRGALRDSTHGYVNVAVGTDAGRYTVLGHRNTFVGSNAGKWVGSLDPAADDHPREGDVPPADDTFDFKKRLPNQGSRNTLVGRNAGHEGVQIQSCVAVGYNAGAHWLQNESAVAVGRNALLENAEARRTIAIGTFAMDKSLTGAEDCVVVGHEALRHATGNNNVALGAFAAEELTEGGQNVFIGEQCAAQKQRGSNNVFVGRFAGEQNTHGSRNIFIGRMAGRTAQGSDQLIIHNTAVGPAFLWGNMGNADAWWLRVRGDLEPSGYGAWSLGSQKLRWKQVYAINGTIQTSDRAMKTDIRDDDLGLEFIRALRPVVWRWKDDQTQADHRGLVAQEVRACLASFPDRRGFAGLVDDGGPLGLCMTEFIGPMVKALQELDARSVELETRLNASALSSPPRDLSDVQTAGGGGIAELNEETA